jgi:hypothetical protein
VRDLAAAVRAAASYRTVTVHSVAAMTGLRELLFSSDAFAHDSGHAIQGNRDHA